eukprot:jgi/Ulvmu1/10924/UM007_0103.1
MAHRLAMAHTALLHLSLRMQSPAQQLQGTGCYASPCWWQVCVRVEREAPGTQGTFQQAVPRRISMVQACDSGFYSLFPSAAAWLAKKPRPPEASHAQLQGNNRSTV